MSLTLKAAIQHRSADAAPDIKITSACPWDNWQTYTESAALLAKTATHPTDGQKVGQLPQTLATNPSSRISTASHAGSVVACCYSKLSADRTHGWIGGLAANPDYRGNGLASRIVAEAVADRAVQDGFEAVIFSYIRVPNPASVKAFHASGFVAKHPLRVPVRDIESIAAHFAATAMGPDKAVGLLLMVRVGNELSWDRLTTLSESDAL